MALVAVAALAVAVWAAYTAHRAAELSACQQRANVRLHEVAAEALAVVASHPGAGGEQRLARRHAVTLYGSELAQLQGAEGQSCPAGG